MKDATADENGDFSEVSAKLDQVTQALASVVARLDDLEGSEKGEFGKKLGEQSKHVADALLDYIEAHPVRATAIGFLLGALIFRGRG